MYKLNTKYYVKINVTHFCTPFCNPMGCIFSCTPLLHVQCSIPSPYIIYYVLCIMYYILCILYYVWTNSPHFSPQWGDIFIHLTFKFTKFILLIGSAQALLGWVITKFKNHHPPNHPPFPQLLWAALRLYWGLLTN